MRRRLQRLVGMLGCRGACCVRGGDRSHHGCMERATPGCTSTTTRPYEPAALKRLMGRYATREAEVDRLLRAKRFVDLHAVVKHALRASVEKYSIKDLEPFYGFVREVSLADARVNLRVVERALELADPDAITPEVRAAVEGYNRDDCRSARAASRLAGASAHRGRAARRHAGAAPAAPGRRGTGAHRRAGSEGRSAAADPRRRLAGGTQRAQRRAAGALAARLHAGLAPPGDEGAGVGVVPVA